MSYSRLIWQKRTFRDKSKILDLLSVNGNYTSWTSWSECSVSCGNGTKSRQRDCANPAPKYGGKDCSSLGASDELQVCLRDPCPRMLSLDTRRSVLFLAILFHAFCLVLILNWVNSILQVTVFGQIGLHGAHAQRLAEMEKWPDRGNATRQRPLTVEHIALVTQLRRCSVRKLNAVSSAPFYLPLRLMLWVRQRCCMINKLWGRSIGIRGSLTYLAHRIYSQTVITVKVLYTVPFLQKIDQFNQTLKLLDKRK